jgi:hypothetical protein
VPPSAGGESSWPAVPWRGPISSAARDSGGALCEERSDLVGGRFSLRVSLRPAIAGPRHTEVRLDPMSGGVPS